MSSRLKLPQFVEPNRRILIVDDNRAIHDDFRKILGPAGAARDELDALDAELFGTEPESPDEGFLLDSAYQGEEAIEKVRAAHAQGAPYALLFVDVRMPPGLDGIVTTARLLREDPDVGIVICSAYSDHSWEEMTAAFGKTDRVLILKKPFDTVEVRQLAHALQRRWELARLAAVKVQDLTALIDAQTAELRAANEALKKEAALREEALQRLGESNEQIRALAYEDGLTGLPNRRLFTEHLVKVLARSRRKGAEFALLFIDIDNFKLINDTIGHQAADEVLRQLAESLGLLIRTDDMLGLYHDEEIDSTATISLEPVSDAVLSRLGGDEFVMLLPDTRDRFAAGTVARRILAHLEQPITVEGHEVFVTASIGISTYPEDGLSNEILIRNADTAMYHAKQQGKAAFQYYSAAMNAASVERLTLETGLRRALEDGSLKLHYQPQVEMKTGKIIGAEALLRWEHPQRGHISPGSFIPIAEASGLIVPIGEWVFRTACRQLRQWEQDGLPPITVSINISPRQFMSRRLVATLLSIIRETGADPRHIELEITETMIMRNIDQSVETLTQLRAAGMHVAVDDFGVGYSSLNQLTRLPASSMKIDRSFIANLPGDLPSGSITEAIIAMAKRLKLRVIAEGVENAAQLEFLRANHCEAFQGYYFSRPVTAAEATAMLKAQATARATPAAATV